MTTTPVQNTSPLKDLDLYTGREIAFDFYSFRKGDPKEAKFNSLRQEIEQKLANDEPVYVSFTDDRRQNSVGRIKSCTFVANERKSNYSYSMNKGDIYVYVSISNIEVVWDGRSNKVKPSCSEIQYLPDWTGGTQWAWEQHVRPKVEPIIAYDHLGQQLEIGQNVCFVHRIYGRASMHFGTVTRFTKSGTVFAKTMKLRDNERAGVELKASSMDDVVILNDNLMKRLVMAKLAAN